MSLNMRIKSTPERMPNMIDVVYGAMGQTNAKYLINYLEVFIMTFSSREDITSFFGYDFDYLKVLLFPAKVNNVGLSLAFYTKLDVFVGYKDINVTFTKTTPGWYDEIRQFWWDFERPPTNFSKQFHDGLLGSVYDVKILNPYSIKEEEPSVIFDKGSSWRTCYLNDKKMHAVSVGKTFQFTKIKNADGSPHTGGETETFSVDRGGLTAKGFKQNPSEGLFLERSNELLPGTFVIGGLIFGSGAGNYLNGINKIINNATDPLSGFSQGAKAYVRNINENMTNVSKIISQGNVWTGTILKGKTFMSAVGSGSLASMSLLEAMGFGTMMGLTIISGIELGNVVVDKVKEYVTPQGTYKLDKYSNLFDIYQTSDYIDGLIQQAEANAKAQNESSATTHAENGTNSAEQLDEWEKQQAEAQAQADAQAKEKAEAEKAALELETETLKKDVLTVIKEKLTSLTNIIDVLHTEATQTYDGSLTRPEAKQQAFELEYSKQIEEDYTDTAGNTQSILKGSKANTKINTRKNIEQHVKDYSDNESYAELNKFNPSEYLHEEREIVPNSTYEEKEYKIMALAMELISGTITKEQYETKLNELR